MDSSEQDWARYEETLAESAERYGTPGTDSYAARIPTPPAFLRHPHSYAARIRDRRALPRGTSPLGFALMVLCS